MNTEVLEDKDGKYSFLKVIILSLVVVLIFLIAVSQKNSLDTVTISILIIVWFFPIPLIGIPSWRESVSDYLKYLNPISIPFVFVFFPYVLLLITGGTKVTSVFDLVLWYLVPTLLFLLPEILETKIQPEIFPVIRIIVNVIAVAILWIGFDNRYSSSLFVGFNGAYELNALWIACVMMTTYGHFVGVENPKNNHDKGLMPNKYGVKLASIALPLALLTIVPFGLLTGFLDWDPQKFNLLVIAISFIGVYLTIALQEEFVFRGIIQNELTKLDYVKSKQYIEYGVIVLVTITFALSHWNNDVPPYVYYYFVFAFIAGLAYAISYKKGGLFASIFTHTLVDWLWALLFKRV